jgi:hypothetical protein
MSFLHLATIRTERSHAEGRAIVCEVVVDRRGDECAGEGARNKEEGGGGEHGGGDGFAVCVVAAVSRRVGEGRWEGRAGGLV